MKMVFTSAMMALKVLKVPSNCVKIEARRIILGIFASHLEEIMKAYKVFLVDDHPILLIAVHQWLSQSTEFEVVGTSGCAREALAFVKGTKVDVVITDLVLPGQSGLELIHDLREWDQSIRIVIFSGFFSFECIANAFRLGAAAFLEKTITPDAFLSSIRAIMAGKLILSPRVSRVLQELIKSKDGYAFLSKVELKVLRMMAMNLPLKELASRLKISCSCAYRARARVLSIAGEQNELAKLYMLANSYALSHVEVSFFSGDGRGLSDDF